MKKKPVKVTKDMFKDVKFKLNVKVEPKCRHTWTEHDCSCDYCDMHNAKECTKCGEIK